MKEKATRPRRKTEPAEPNQIEKELRETNAFLQNILESSSYISIISTDLKSNILYWNKGAENIFGYKPEEVVGIHKMDILYDYEAEIKKKIETLRSAIFNEKKGGSCEVREVTKDGRKLWINLTITPRLDDNNDVIGILGIGQDITERKLAEDALRESEEKYRTLVENLNDVIFTVDMDGYVTYISPVITQVMGYMPNEVISQHFSRFIYPEDLQDLTSRFERVMAGYLEPYECRMFDRNNQIRYVLTSSRKLMKTGEPVGMIGRITDITQQRQLEEQLRQSQKMEAIGQLAGGVAHDFNNLLQAIIGYSQLAMTTVNSGDPIFDYVKEIARAGERASTLTRQLLAFSRRQTLQPQIFSINIMVDDMSKMLRRLIRENIELIADLSPAIMLIRADPGQVEQVIMNLVVNARDAMPDGGKLTIKTENITLSKEQCRLFPEAKPGKFIRLSVSDTGTGMSEEIIQRVFEPFFTTKGSGGTGLGLSVVHGIVKQHGGLIDIQSELGRGSTFAVYLPTVTTKQKGSTQERLLLQRFCGNGERILLVEDEKPIRGFAVSALREFGYVVFEAESVDNATSIFDKENMDFNLIICDIVLSDKSGLELVNQLISVKPEIRILLSSGSVDHATYLKIVTEKGFQILQKPYTLADLLRTVKEVIKPARRGGSLGSSLYD